MSAASKARAVTRWAAVGLMATAVLTATGGGFAQSYAGLYEWAIEHGLTGWKASSFPLLVDLFIIVGELGLFLLALDAYAIRKNLLSWMDFMLPLFIALAGWTASLIFNVGHVLNREFSYQATAAVPPIVSMLGLFVLLRTLHRYIATNEKEKAEPAEPAPALPLQQITVMQIPAAAEPKGALEAAATSANGASATAGGAKLNGSGKSRGSAPESPGEQTFVDLVPDPDLKPQPDPESMRGIVIEVLGRHNGDIGATCAELAADGYAIDEHEVGKIRENHWFPYFTYRLLAKHGPDGKLVAQELTDMGIDFDRESLRDLVRSWRA
ncbi:MAG: DUF2637 domain-containing protein [Streptosporangiaceae bacterium]